MPKKQTGKGIKKLVVNGSVYAHYILEQDTIFINVNPEHNQKRFHADVSANEQFCIHLISLVENAEINFEAYLNLDA